MSDRSRCSPASPGVHMSYGHALKTLGDQAEALREYRAAIAQKPDFGEVYWSMANLKVFRFEDAEVAAMEEQVQRDGPEPRAPTSTSASRSARPMRTRATTTAPGSYYRHGQPAPAPARVLRSRGLRGPSRADRGSLQPRVPRAACGRRASSPDAPIFIVGLPRSGSTLIEQILASHSQVEGTLELPTLGDIAVSIGALPARPQASIPKPCATCAAGTSAPTGSSTSTRRGSSARPDRPRFTDKLPNNFSHVGFIHLILPNAKIINARRHPFDSCLGSYKQLFGKGQNFTYDMNELAMYYRQYHEIMKHWHRVLPGKVLDVHYEETVGDLETQVRRILAHCGLPFEEACLRFHETKRAVRTASSEQVRQPLYTRALGTWRRYEKHLDRGRKSSPTSSRSCPKASATPGSSRTARPRGRGWRCARPSSGSPTAAARSSARS